MAYYTGYVDIPHDSYNQWKNATNGNGYNYDFLHGCQYYDLLIEFWYNVGFPQGYPLIANGSAYSMWENRQENASYNGVTYFDLVYDMYDIQVGDIVVFNQTSGNNGQVGFADVNFSDSGWSYPDLPILSQGNGGYPDPQGGAYTNVNTYSLINTQSAQNVFLGAFRYRAWHEVPPVPSSTTKKTHFKWAIYANKIRKRY